MTVLVTGGSGFVGRAVVRRLLREGNQVLVLSRSADAGVEPGARVLRGDPTQPGDWQDAAARCDRFVNLAGASIFGRWTPERKRAILQSRVLATRHLVQAIGRRESAEPAVLFSASAVGFYGPRGDEMLGETDPNGTGFLAQVAREWEAEANLAQASDCRVVIGRFGVVLGHDGGALAQMLPIFRLGLGGRLGSGRQWFSWIHRQDLAGVIATALADADWRGVINCTAPQPVTNEQFTRALARVLRRPAFLPVPAWGLRLVWGEMASMLLEGQRVVPTVLAAQGFDFAHPTIAGALRHLLDR